MFAYSVLWGQAAYQNPDLSPETRAVDLVSRMTLDEKVLQMQNTAPAIARLGIPEYDWWNEALHGVALPDAALEHAPVLMERLVPQAPELKVPPTARLAPGLPEPASVARPPR